MKAIAVTFFSLLSLFLVSCIQPQEIEQLTLVNVQGVDYLEKDRLKLSLATFLFSDHSDEFSTLVYGKGKTIKGAMEDAEDSTIFKLEAGKMKLMVFGKEISEKGILSLLDTAARDARVPSKIYLSVSKTTAQEILSTGKEELVITDISQFLNGLIENDSLDHNIPRKTIQDFLRIYYDIGQDNVLPLFEIKNNLPKLSALAVFQGDKFVGEITNDEAVLINLMVRRVKENLLELSVPIEPFEDYIEEIDDDNKQKKINIAVLISNGKSKTKLIDTENLIFETDTTMELRLLEQSVDVGLIDPRAIQLMEKEIEKKIEGRFENLLKKLQEFEADSFGYGLYYKSKEAGKDLTRDEWREKYSDIDVRFNVQAKITRHGKTD